MPKIPETNEVAKMVAARTESSRGEMAGGQLAGPSDVSPEGGAYLQASKRALAANERGIRGGECDTGLMGYLRTHWSGGHSLARSFWINFVLPFLLVAALQRLARPPWVEDLTLFAVLAAVYVLLYCAFVYPWQLVGLARACDRHLGAYGERSQVVAIHGTMFVSLLVTLVAGFGMAQSGIALYRAQGAPLEAPGPGYAFHLVANGALIRVAGSLDPGVTRDLRQLLAEQPRVRVLLLASDGGNIYEARGVARLIAERGLATRVETTCKSACTTAFIGGVTRVLGSEARLGFHAYRLQAQQPLIDVAAEQEKDRAFYRSQGVDPAFLVRIFDAPHDSIWYPEPDELLRAGVVHRIEAPSGPAR